MTKYANPAAVVTDADVARVWQRIPAPPVRTKLL